MYPSSRILTGEDDGHDEVGPQAGRIGNVCDGGDINSRKVALVYNVDWEHNWYADEGEERKDDGAHAQEAEEHKGVQASTRDDHFVLGTNYGRYPAEKSAREHWRLAAIDGVRLTSMRGCRD